MYRRRAHSRASQQADTPLLHRIASILLRYPDQQTLSLLDDVTAALPAIGDRTDRARLAAFAGWLQALSPTEAAQAYVETFDHTSTRSLHLTYYRHGDTRARGMALLALRHTYRRAGHEPPGSELPDYLPLVLEFAAVAPEPGGRILVQSQASLEMLRRALHERTDPYAPVLDAVCGRLPDLKPRQRETLRRLSEQGPPKEQVGLEPFAPPEFLSGTASTSGEGR